jgi:hypothetical protein
MIWFACKECGKRHHRPEEAAGTLVFCSCGAGNRVPWESTAPADEGSGEPAEPVPVPAATPWGGSERPTAEADEPAPRRGRAVERRPRDPAHCLNHPEAAATQTCEECREAFCDGCVVTLQGRTLCGPCKNFRLRARERPATPSAFAIMALVVGIMGGPWGFCLMTGMANRGEASTAFLAFFGVLGIACPLVALGLGLKAIWDVNHQPRLAGRGLAVTGMTLAAAGLLWSLTLLLLVAYKQVLGV